MKFINTQAFHGTIATDDQAIYTPANPAQIRAVTVHNPTADSVVLGVTINDVKFISLTVTASSTEVCPALFNQQLAKGDTLKIEGVGLNVWLTTVEIVE